MDKQQPHPQPHPQPNQNQAPLPKKPQTSTLQSQSRAHKPASRRIPQTLIQSYDLITLNQQKKKKFNFKKHKQQSIKQQPQVLNPVLEELKPLFGECTCAQELKEEFSEVIVYQLTATLFVLSKVCSLRIKNITKLKLIGEAEGQSNILRPLLIKITWGQNQKQEDNIFVKLKSQQEAFFLFSSMITRKLLLQDFGLLEINKSEFKTFQGSVNNLEGDIYKNSTFTRKWEKRQAKISDEFVIFKQGKPQKQIKNIKQVWTRFSMHYGFFIVKMFQGFQKYQIGIPLTDFSNVKSQRNWLYLFSKLIK